MDTVKRPSFKEDPLYKHIADTYFYQKNRPKSKKKKDIPPINYLARVSMISLALVISLAILITMFSFSHRSYTDTVKKRIAGMKVVTILNKGSINKDLVRTIQFRGYAKEGKSSISKNMVILNNPQKYNWADVSMDFKFPIDVSSRDLSLSLRGNTGGEKINIVLRDASNRSFRTDDISVPYNWSNKTIPLEKRGSNIDMTKVDHLRIETGYVGESSGQKDSLINVMIYVKDISLIKEI